jgi:hypothetical protein
MKKKNTSGKEIDDFLDKIIIEDNKIRKSNSKKKTTKLKEEYAKVDTLYILSLIIVPLGLILPWACIEGTCIGLLSYTIGTLFLILFILSGVLVLFTKIFSLQLSLISSGTFLIFYLERIIFLGSVMGSKSLSLGIIDLGLSAGIGVHITFLGLVMLFLKSIQLLKNINKNYLTTCFIIIVILGFILTYSFINLRFALYIL